MAIITQAIAGKCKEANGRLESTITAKFGVGQPQQVYRLNISYQKHAISSYKLQAVQPQAADINTLVNMDFTEFKMAFDDYVRLLSVKITGQESTTFSPSAIANRIFTKGIGFSSDVNNLGGNIHCFPYNDGPAKSPKAVSISRTALLNFKKVTSYIYQNNGTLAGAKLAWQSISALAKSSIGKPNELFSSIEFNTMKVRLGGGTDNLSGRVRQEQGAIRRVQGISGGLNNGGRAPFRG